MFQAQRDNQIIWTLLWVSVFSAAVFIGACGGDEDEENDDTGGDEDWSAWTGSCTDNGLDTLPTGTTWQWQITDDVDHSVDVEMYDVDLFNVTAAEIAELQGEGRFVVCYFSAGTWEDWRDDAAEFEADAVGSPMEEWPDESWLDVRHQSTRDMLEARLDIAETKGCDGVEPDNMDGYVNNTGFDFTGMDQLDFNKFVADAAHDRGLSVGLKNDVDQLEPLVNCFDWALNEECFAYDECDKYQPFVDAGKAVFHVEYVDAQSEGDALANDVCGEPSIEGFSTLIKDWDLTAWYIDCL